MYKQLFYVGFLLTLHYEPICNLLENVIFTIWQYKKLLTTFYRFYLMSVSSCRTKALFSFFFFFFIARIARLSAVNGDGLRGSWLYHEHLFPSQNSAEINRVEPPAERVCVWTSWGRLQTQHPPCETRWCRLCSLSPLWWLTCCVLWYRCPSTCHTHRN